MSEQDKALEMIDEANALRKSGYFNQKVTEVLLKSKVAYKLTLACGHIVMSEDKELEEITYVECIRKWADERFGES